MIKLELKVARAPTTPLRIEPREKTGAKVGQARKGACILSNLLTRFDARFIEAPFADENTPNSAITHGEVSSPCLALNFGVQNSRFILNMGILSPLNEKLGRPNPYSRGGMGA